MRTLQTIPAPKKYQQFPSLQYSMYHKIYSDEMYVDFHASFVNKRIVSEKKKHTAMLMRTQWKLHCTNSMLCWTVAGILRWTAMATTINVWAKVFPRVPNEKTTRQENVCIIVPVACAAAVFHIPHSMPPYTSNGCTECERDSREWVASIYAICCVSLQHIGCQQRFDQNSNDHIHFKSVCNGQPHD